MCEEFSGPENSYLNLLSEIKYLDNLFKCLVFVLIECVFSVGITQCVCQRVGSVQTEVCIWRQTTTGWPSTQYIHTTQHSPLYYTQTLYNTEHNPSTVKYTQATQPLYFNVAVKTPSYTHYTTNFNTLTIQPTPLGFDTTNCCTGH